MKKLLLSLIMSAIIVSCHAQSPVQISRLLIDPAITGAAGTATVTVEAIGGSGQYVFLKTVGDVSTPDADGIFQDVEEGITTFTVLDQADENNFTQLTITNPANSLLERVDYVFEHPCAQTAFGSLRITARAIEAVTELDPVLTQDDVPVGTPTVEFVDGNFLINFNAELGSGNFVMTLTPEQEVPPITGPNFNLIFNLVESPEILVTVETTDATGAAGGTVTATASGGTGPFRFFLDGVQAPQTGTSATFGNVTAGLHTLRVEDVTNTLCAKVQAVTVNQAPPVVVNRIFEFIQTKFCNI